MTRINYRNDFEFELEVLDATGFKSIPSFDWQARFYTRNRLQAFIAQSIGGVLSGCRIQDGKLMITADGHGLMPGRLNVEFFSFFPNESYPDGVQRLLFTKELDIELVPTASDAPADLQVTAALSALIRESNDIFSETDYYKSLVNQIAVLTNRIPNPVGMLELHVDSERYLVPIMHESLFQNLSNIKTYRLDLITQTEEDAPTQ